MIDVTFDFETCATCPTAAVMSIGAVMWQRNSKDTPFFLLDNRSIDPWFSFSCHIDMRSQFVNKGFTFDEKTQEWWSSQSNEAKLAVLENDDDDIPCRPIEQTIVEFFSWIADRMKELGETEVCVWSQGTDFDVAILRNICYVFNIDIPVYYGNFRDHRTFFLEGARTICNCSGAEFYPKKAYALVEPYSDGGAVHTPLFDCKRSIYSTWQMMKHLECLNKK